MNRNVGRLDRIARGVFGIWLLVVATSAYQDNKYERAAIAGIAGAGLLPNVLFGYCGGNDLFGIDTTAGSRDSE
ncbi:YgaP-like transmembrane domain [Natronolimnobius baerhuensis]|uniref:Inner membrane protein YgaP-like transmembrane domain-containing protein n=1 Tax=Natronolimnobius baerhuensis TaxID=253108 RepID=A0A202EAS5_9EURY|nr:YgaP-like transmembrane domain [Natronolimnobius baerhuensis]OVE85339.1 hypothetical protein B2G88_00475 [Natronolimnobius baerhuensis]